MKTKFKYFDEKNAKMWAWKRIAFPVALKGARSDVCLISKRDFQAIAITMIEPEMCVWLLNTFHSFVSVATVKCLGEQQKNSTRCRTS